MTRLEPYLEDFASIPHAALARYRGYPQEILIEHSKRSAASCTYDHMVEEAVKLFSDREDVRLLDLRGLKLWLIGKDEHTVVRWKKMDEDGRSRRYPTK